MNAVTKRHRVKNTKSLQGVCPLFDLWPLCEGGGQKENFLTGINWAPPLYEPLTNPAFTRNLCWGMFSCELIQSTHRMWGPVCVCRPMCANVKFYHGVCTLHRKWRIRMKYKPASLTSWDLVNMLTRETPDLPAQVLFLLFFFFVYYFSHPHRAERAE